jgi:hypothetical protein
MIDRLQPQELECQHPTAICQRPSRRDSVFAVAAAVLLLWAGPLLAEGGGDALFIDKDGRVGIGKSPLSSTLDVGGDARIDGALDVGKSGRIDGDLNVGGNAQVNGTLGIGGNSQIKGALDVDGDGRVGGTLGIGGNSRIKGALDVDGDGRVGGKLDVSGHAQIEGTVTSRARYQRDDEPEATYEISPRYHLSLTGRKYDGRTKTIPMDTLLALCADHDGCQVRLAMTRWDNDAETESASVFFTFYYSKDDGHWRASYTDASDAKGVDGDGTTQFARRTWGACEFTDGIYDNNADKGDKEKGMQLRVARRYTNANRTCELTLID